MIHRDRMTARLDGAFAVFLIGMRFNQLWRADHWGRVLVAMPKMLIELKRRPELGLLHAEQWFGRTTLMVQYWRSLEQLMAYATARDSAHLPAWQAFNRAVGTSGSVGIWHETYLARPGSFENVYVNMPPFGLGRAGELVPARGGLQSARARLRAGAPGEAGAPPAG